MNQEYESLIDQMDAILRAPKWDGRHERIRQIWTRVKKELAFPLIVENERLKRPWWKRIITKLKGGFLNARKSSHRI